MGNTKHINCVCDLCILGISDCYNNFFLVYQQINKLYTVSQLQWIIILYKQDGCVVDITQTT